MKEKMMKTTPTSRPTKSLPLLASIIFAAALVVALSFATSALASESRVVVAEFGPDGTAESSFDANYAGYGVCDPQNPRFGLLGSLALDQTDQRLYAGASCPIASAAKISGFDASLPETFTPLAGNFPIITTGNQGLTGLLVDNTGSSADGNIYGVALNFNKPPSRVVGYDASGAPLSGFPFEDATASGFRSGALDPEGHIWIVDWQDEATTPTIRKYSATGSFEGTPIDTTGLGRPYVLTFDSSGDAYVGMLDGKVYEFSAASSYASHTEVAAAGAGEGGSQALEVDPETQDLYIVRNGKVEVYDSAGAFLYSFGERPEAGYIGYRAIAIDPATDRVFLAANSTQQILAFGHYGPVVEFTLSDASGLSGSHASLAGAVQPAGTTITECKFEFGRAKGLGSSVPCEGAIPADSSPHPVSATLAGLLPQGTTYYYRLAVKKSGGEVVHSAIKSFVTANTLATEAATSVDASSAVLNGSINPDGEPLTECQFEYGPSPAYGESAPCEPPADSIPPDGNAHSVSTNLSELLANGTYHFRVVAATAAGSFAGEDESFTTTGPPVIEEETASGVEGTSVTLAAQVDPRGAATTVHFEWGTDSAYGNRVPEGGELSVGSGSGSASASTLLDGLSEGTTYHFRAVATSARGTSYGPDQTFTTASSRSCPNATIRAEQISPALPDGAVELPECMALEMVTPPRKFNQDAYKPGFSFDGNRIKFQSDAALADAPKLGGLLEHYVATRGSAGWTTTATATPPQYSVGSVVNATPCSYSQDLSHWALWGSTPAQSQLGITTAFRGGLDGSFKALSPTLVPVDSLFGTFAVAEGACEGSSADASHELLRIGNGERSAVYLPGDPHPQDSELSGGRSGLVGGDIYEAHRNASGEPEVELLARDKDGHALGGMCGAEVGGVINGNAHALRGSISDDASRIFFSTRPGQPEGVPCEGDAHGVRVMERTMGPDGPEISAPVSSECTRVSPPCDNGEGDDVFLGASQEGDKFYLTTTRQLANSDLDTTEDLYLYDSSRPAGSRLTQVSAGDATDPVQGEGANVLGVADFSGDGAHVYFVATGQLTARLNEAGRQALPGKPNLYSYERDAAHPSGSLAFVATLDPGDSVWDRAPGENNAAAVPILGQDLQDPTVGGDGHVLVFITTASLLPADTDGGAADVYRYDADSGALQLVSRSVPGGSDNGPFDVQRIEENVWRVLPNLLSFDRWVSNDGGTIVFQTEEGLSPKDTDGRPSAYVWHDGSLSAFPFPSEMATVSLSGREVAFVTGSRLLPEDGDGAKDVYVARAGGGFPAPEPVVECSGEPCQGPPTPPPPGEGAATGALGVAEAGNVPAKRPSCRKGFHRRRGKGPHHKRGRCVKRQSKKQHAKRRGHGRRSAQERGGKK